MEKEELVNLLTANGYTATIEDGIPVVKIEVNSEKEFKATIRKIEELKQGYNASFGYRLHRNDLKGANSHSNVSSEEMFA